MGRSSIGFLTPESAHLSLGSYFQLRRDGATVDGPTSKCLNGGVFGRKRSTHDFGSPELEARNPPSGDGNGNQKRTRGRTHPLLNYLVERRKINLQIADSVFLPIVGDVLFSDQQRSHLGVSSARVDDTTPMQPIPSATRDKVGSRMKTSPSP